MNIRKDSKKFLELKFNKTEISRINYNINRLKREKNLDNR